MMGACELSWWLVAAACALAMSAEDEVWGKPPPVDLQCGVNTSPHCMPTSDLELFLIYGQQHRMSYLNGENFEASCTAASFDENVWPFFPEPVSFPTVTLRNCSAPKAYSSFQAALLSLNITFTKTLRLYDLQSTAIILNKTLEGVSKYLEIAAAKDSIVSLQPDALLGLESLQTLSVTRVRFGQLPPNIVNLHMNQTGFTKLDQRSFNRLNRTLSITVENMHELSIEVPSVRFLRVNSPDLSTLKIINATLLAFGSWSLSGCKKLDTLVLSYIQSYGELVPSDLLEDLGSLSNFVLTLTQIDWLPESLFADTPNLKMVDLSRNRLKSLPRELLKGLNGLETLNLNDNDIYFTDLNFLADKHKLTQLGLRGNRVASLCPEGTISPLANLSLHYLDLSNSNLAHICKDWIQTLRGMYQLSLHNNTITSLNCVDLQIVRSTDWTDRSIIDLDNNDITEYKCSKEDYERMRENPGRQHAELIVPQLSCDCGAYWLKRVLEARDVIITERNPRICNQTCA